MAVHRADTRYGAGHFIGSADGSHRAAAAAAELAGLTAIELSGDAMFAELGIVFPSGPATVEVAIAHGAEIFVAGDPPGELRVYRWVTGSESRPKFPPS